MRFLLSAIVIASALVVMPHTASATGPCNPDIQDCY
jgi:hypothetical protein